MDAMSIIKDSLRYTISDIVQLFVLSVPAIIIILLSVSSIIYFDLDFLVVLSPLYFILGIFLALFYSGLMLNVIRHTVNLNDVLPEINLKLFLLDGLKYIIVEFVLVGITGGIIYFLSEYVKLHTDFALVIFIFIIIFAIISIYLSVLNVVASGKLAQTNSLADALSFGQLREVADRIGKLKIYVTLLLAGILTSILMSFFSFLMGIPIFGVIIFAFIMTLSVVFNGRVVGLLYNERNLKENSVSVEQSDSVSSTDFDYNKYSRDDIKEGPVSQDSFEEYLESSEQEDLTQTSLTRCSKCGHSNPDFVDLCLNCGEKL
ncbi:DUF4013 domain-containing protein [Methanosphaera sp. BMS]|uniref:DUF4013 domain-containing protein n=1 Tax=Methanosphaera sp. BMS TaxID=1789762 RepID=UPI000DC1CC6B|nr:DUF4013 domain-containing protein [Methanosphaera sp. BMS]AWX32233.1 hypothetical protein AW729_03555 [Methanosphaera sp. BMS]